MKHYLYGAVVATPDPGEAPPVAEFNIKYMLIKSWRTDMNPTQPPKISTRLVFSIREEAAQGSV